MLQIDSRIGSGELCKYLAMLKVPIEVTTLAFGDFSFLGRGPGEVPVPIGVERKALSDWVSSFYSGRFAGHQLPGMLQCFEVIYVVIEGVWRVDIQTGLVMVPKGSSGKKTLWEPLEAGGSTGLLYRDLEEIFMTFEMKGGCLFRRTGNKPETCRFLNALYQWWTIKAWDEHKSHLRFRTVDADKAILTPLDPSNPKHLVRLMTKELKLVGWEKAREIAERYPTMALVLGVSVKEWESVPGIGKTLASRMWKALHGG